MLVTSSLKTCSAHYFDSRLGESGFELEIGAHLSEAAYKEFADEKGGVDVCLV